MDTVRPDSLATDGPVGLLFRVADAQIQDLETSQGITRGKLPSSQGESHQSLEVGLQHLFSFKFNPIFTYFDI